MDIAILVLLAMAVAHFVYEEILAPSFRQRLRFHLFQQRDRLRALRISLGDALKPEAFGLLQDSANTAIRLLPSIDITTVIEVNSAFSHDRGLRERVAKRVAILKGCKVPEIQEINRELAISLAWAIAVNNGLLLAIIVPAVIGVVYWRRWLSFIGKILAVPGGEVDRIMPTSGTAFG